MKIQILSDMHTEFWRGKTERFPEIIGDVLVLAGDICTSESLAMLASWLETIKVPVVYVLGNHEYYYSSLGTQLNNVRDALFHLDHVHILENETVEIYGVSFIGTTLWTALSPISAEYVKFSMPDTKVIAGLSIPTWNRLHDKAVNYIKHCLVNTRGKDRVVVTHHTPSYKSCAPRWLGDAVNAGFHTSLEHILLQEEHPLIWIHGHTHDAMDYEIYKTRVVCNPMGYPKERAGEGLVFDPGKIIEI